MTKALGAAFCNSNPCCCLFAIHWWQFLTSAVVDDKQEVGIAHALQLMCYKVRWKSSQPAGAYKSLSPSPLLARW